MFEQHSLLRTIKPSITIRNCLIQVQEQVLPQAQAQESCSQVMGKEIREGRIGAMMTCCSREGPFVAQPTFGLCHMGSL